MTALQKPLIVLFSIIILLAFGLLWQSSTTQKQTTTFADAESSDQDEIQEPEYVSDTREQPGTKNIAASSIPGLSVSDKAMAKLGTVIDEFETINEESAVANNETANKTIEKRKAELARQLARMGNAGVAAILNSYGTADNIHVKRFMLDALGETTEPAAVEALSLIANNDKQFSNREHATHHLAEKKSKVARDILQQIAEQHRDPRLRIIAVKGLAQYPESRNTIINILKSDKTTEVRLAAIRSAGLLQQSDALQALQFISIQGPNIRVKKQAIMEIGRSYRKAGSDFLETLRSNPDVEIRETAQRARNLAEEPGTS